jgi:hypothetical protein
MSTKKDELVFSSIRTFKEFLNAAGVEWDEAFYRYVEYREEHSFRSAWSCRAGKFMKIYPVDFRLANQYIKKIEGHIRDLCSAIEEEGNSRPVVVVLRVDTTGNYKMKFERQDVNAMQIDSFHVGKANSLFKEGEVLLQS